jgi:site-specific DNA-cytosine methylase
MGYQWKLVVLQAAYYGVPQTWKKAIILAADSGDVFPNYPKPMHV